MDIYFPETICQLVTGLVWRISNVPVLNSSGQSDLMVIAGTKKMSAQVLISKKGPVWHSQNQKYYSLTQIRKGRSPAKIKRWLCNR